MKVAPIKEVKNYSRKTMVAMVS